MGFAAAAPIIAAGISATSSAAQSGKGGGKGGGSSSSNDLFRQQQNFADFQSPAIGRVFDILEGGEGESLLVGGTGRDSLLAVPEQASGALSRGLNFADQLIEGQTGVQNDLRNFQSLINDQFSEQPFTSTIDDIEGIRNAIPGAFEPFISRATALSDEGIDPRAGNLLLETARRDPAANPFIDALVGDVTTDVTNAVRDQFIASGGLEASAAADAIGRESGRVSNQIRSAAFESEAARSLQAQQALGQFDAANASQRLNAAIAGGNLTNQRFGAQLGAQSQINALTQAEEQRQLALLGLRGQNEAQLANLSLAGLNAVGPLATTFTELPFVPLANFSEIAFAPLGQTINQVGTGAGATNPSIFDSLSRGAGLGLTGLGILDETGIFGSGDGGSSNGGFGPFGTNLGPLSPGAGSAPAPPVLSPPSFTPLTGAGGFTPF